MKIAIVGLGVAGSYLANRLSAETLHNVVAFEAQELRNFKSVCGWMTRKEEFEEFAKDCELSPEDYILRDVERGHFKIKDEIATVKVRNGVTIDKHQFLLDLQGNLDGINYGCRFHRDHQYHDLYDLVIDATGFQRSMLGTIPNGDKFVSCRQYTVSYEDLPFDDIFLELWRAGYSWYTPIKEDIAFVGALSFDGTHRAKLHEFMEEYGGQIQEAANRYLRMLPPSLCLPFRDKHIIGVGEAIGVVRPLGGEGIYPALRSAEILFNRLVYEELDMYEEQLLGEFKGQEREWQYSLARTEGNKWACLRHAFRMKHDLVDFSLKQKWAILML